MLLGARRPADYCSFLKGYRRWRKRRYASSGRLGRGRPGGGVADAGPPPRLVVMRRTLRADDCGARVRKTPGGQDVPHRASRDDGAGVGVAQAVGEIHLPDGGVRAGYAGHPRDVTVVPRVVRPRLEGRSPRPPRPARDCAMLPWCVYAAPRAPGPGRETVTRSVPFPVW